jgi:hypothetical protein
VKRLVVFGTAHELQNGGNIHNAEFERRLLFLIKAFKVTTLMEEWTFDRPVSFACQLAKNHLAYKNVGTDSEARFRTFVNAPINYPGHDGTLGPCEEAPAIMEYGPLDNQENREKRMIQNIHGEMENHSAGLFIVGLAHLHSMSARLKESGFDVAAYSWITSQERR